MAVALQPLAWLKAVLHALKHARGGVLGVLVGPEGDNVAQDAVPLFHDAPSSIAAEAALRSVTEWAASQTPTPWKIVGVYHASREFAAKRIAATLGEAPILELDDGLLFRGDAHCWKVRGEKGEGRENVEDSPCRNSLSSPCCDSAGHEASRGHSSGLSGANWKRCNGAFRWHGICAVGEVPGVVGL